MKKIVFYIIRKQVFISWSKPIKNGKLDEEKKKKKWKKMKQREYGSWHSNVNMHKYTGSATTMSCERPIAPVGRRVKHLMSHRSPGAFTVWRSLSLKIDTRSTGVNFKCNNPEWSHDSKPSLITYFSFLSLLFICNNIMKYCKPWIIHDFFLDFLLFYYSAWCFFWIFMNFLVALNLEINDFENLMYLSFD